MGVCACSGEHRVEEVVIIALADFRLNGSVEDRIHRQRQGNHTVTAVDRLQRVGVGACRGEHRIEETVAVAFADLRFNGSVENGIDGQVQRVRALTAVGVGVSIRVSA